MSRGDQLGRQWKIIQTLISSTSGKSVADLADELACHPRTVYRDLEALQIAGFPVYTQRVDGKNLWCLLDTVKHHIPVPFSLTELMALYFSLDMVKVLHDTVFHDSLETLFQKIRATLPSDSVQFLNQVQQTLYVTQKQYKEYGSCRDIINLVNEAAIRKKTVELVYYTMSRRQETTRRVDPYRLWFFNGTFYLIGYCHMRGDIRIFALERIQQGTITQDGFIVPENFSFEDFMHPSFGVIQGDPAQVLIRFDKAVAGYIREKVWHESQRITAREDGSILFAARVAVTDDLTSWILSWGSCAEVLEPPSLRHELEAEIAQMGKRYTHKETT